MTRIIFPDTETSGLYPWAGHRPWEIGYIIRDTDSDKPDENRVYQVKPDLRKADPMALQIGGYYKRFRKVQQAARAANNGTYFRLTKAEAASEIAEDFAGAIVIGNVPSFDTNMLDAFLREHGAAGAWHYHLVDIESVILGYLLNSDLTLPGDIFEFPLNSEKLSLAIGVDPAEYERHTALGDARWVRDQWDTLHRVAPSYIKMVRNAG